MKRPDIIDALRQFKEENQKKYSIQKIGVFGSASRGSFHDKSDIAADNLDKKRQFFGPEIIRLFESGLFRNLFQSFCDPYFDNRLARYTKALGFPI